MPRDSSGTSLEIVRILWNWRISYLLIFSVVRSIASLINITMKKTNIWKGPIVTRLIAIVADALVLLFTWLKTKHIIRHSRGLYRKPSMLMLFVRNGTCFLLCYSQRSWCISYQARYNSCQSDVIGLNSSNHEPTHRSLLLLNLLTIIFDRLKQLTTVSISRFERTSYWLELQGGDLASAFVYINEAYESVLYTYPLTARLLIIFGSLTSSLISHFLLDLRGVYLADQDSAGTDMISTLRFGDSAVGNLGAPLDSGWAEGYKDIQHDERTQTVQFSTSPLSVGLMDEKPLYRWVTRHTSKITVLYYDSFDSSDSMVMSATSRCSRWPT